MWSYPLIKLLHGPKKNRGQLKASRGFFKDFR